MNFQHLYIHIPFCSSKCSYCAFYSESGASDELRAKYLAELKQQIRKNSSKLQELKTIFMGGGTPTLLSANELDDLFSIIKEYTGSKGLLEWSMESNPQTISEEKIAVMKKAGVNRISIGIQSFHSEVRKTIGRHASPESIGKTVQKLNAAGITNINFDLIYGIPGQTTEMWLKDLQQAASYPIKHLSAYSLTIEGDSEIAKANMTVDDDEAVTMLEEGVKYLKENGFERYEISNYCRENAKCLHNYGIWHGETYLGLGPTAASFDGEKRFRQPNSLKLWLQGSRPEDDIITKKERARELFVIGLRTIAGWDLDEFKYKTGFDIETLYSNELNQLIEDGLLKQIKNTISSTEKGLLYIDYISVELV